MARAGVVPEGLIERIGIAANLAPVPAIDALYAPAQSRALQAAVRTGIVAHIAQKTATTEELTAALGLVAEPTRLVCETLVAAGHFERRGDRWALTPRSAKWLDPDSPDSIHAFVMHTADYWAWWQNLEDLMRGGDPVEIHGDTVTPDEWRTYIRGQYELARISAPEVARAIKLPGNPQSLLDVAGGHGWFSAALCERHEGLQATVVDLPGSAAIGREIIAENEMSDRVRHIEGDLRDADLGGPHDAALAFNIIHHLSPEANVALLKRIHEALRPGATVAILDLFSTPGIDSGSILGLFFHLTSGAATYTPGQLADWLAEAGFSKPKRVPIRRIPAQTLFTAKRR